LADDVSENSRQIGIELPNIRDRLHGQLARIGANSVEALIPKPNPNWKPTYE
jgi:hypothetical protein